MIFFAIFVHSWTNATQNEGFVVFKRPHCFILKSCEEYVCFKTRNHRHLCRTTWMWIRSQSTRRKQTAHTKQGLRSLYLHSLQLRIDLPKGQGVAKGSTASMKRMDAPRQAHWMDVPRVWYTPPFLFPGWTSKVHSEFSDRGKRHSCASLS